jgi:hypothetical protein
MFGHKAAAEVVVITREKAGQASRDAAFQTALDAPPGSAPLRSAGEDPQDF